MERIEAMLLSVHTMGASLFAAPELEIDPDEARAIAAAVKRVTDLYKLSIDPRKVAWLDLSSILVAVYGGRCVRIYKRVNADHPTLPPKPQVRLAPAVHTAGPAIPFPDPLTTRPDTLDEHFQPRHVPDTRGPMQPNPNYMPIPPVESIDL